MRVLLGVLVVMCTLVYKKSYSQTAIGTPLIVKSSYHELLRLDTVKALAVTFELTDSDNVKLNAVKCYLVKEIYVTNESAPQFPEINKLLLLIDRKTLLKNFVTYTVFNW